MKQLSPAAIERGVACLSALPSDGRRCSALTLRAVATSAVREAENAAEFLDACRRDAGVEVEVVSGVEEARLIHLGVLQALPVYDRQLLLIDIGGGSTEFLVGKGGEMLWARSLKLGAIRLTERFFPEGRVSAKRVARAAAVPAVLPQPRRPGRSRPTASRSRRAARARSRTWRWSPRTCATARRRCRSTATCSHGPTSTAPSRRCWRRPARPSGPRCRGWSRSGPTSSPPARSSLQVTFEVLEPRRRSRVSAYALREGILLDQLPSPAGDRLRHLSDLRWAVRRPPSRPLRGAPPPCGVGHRAGARSCSTPPGPCTACPRPGRRLPRGRVAAGQHRPLDRPRRPPQALVLPDPPHRAADRLHQPRGRADRADRPLPPQERARRRSTPSSPRCPSATSGSCACWPGSSASASRSIAANAASSAACAPASTPTATLVIEAEVDDPAEAASSSTRPTPPRTWPKRPCTGASSSAPLRPGRA